MLRSIICAAVAAVLLPGAAWAKTLDTTLPNGMRVIVREDNRSPVAVVQLWYRVGSIDEKAGKTGLSHVLEHMMFKGTQSVPAGEFSRRIAAMGGQDNAYTSREETVYYETVAAARLPEVLALEADRMQHLAFSDQDFRNEMKVVSEERRMRSEDQPAGVLWEGMYAHAYRKSANRSPVIGWMKDIAAYRPEDARAWYRQWYAPNNAVLVIVGDVEAQGTLNTVKNLFGAISSQPLPQRNDLREPKSRGIVRAQVAAPSDQPMLALAFKVPRLDEKNAAMPYQLSMLAQVLDGNEASRLGKYLVRQEPVATTVDVGYSMLSRAPEGLFTVVAMPAKGVSVATLQERILAQLQDIADHGVSEAELTRIRTQMRAAEEYKKDSMSVQAGQIGRLELVGLDYRQEPQILARLLNVEAAQVQEAARWLLQVPRTVVTLKPLPLTARTQTGLAAKGDVHVR